MDSTADDRPRPARDARVPGGVVVTASAVAAAVGAGELVAAVVAPGSSPFGAVGDAVVRLAPPWAVEFGKSLTVPGLAAGVADKLALQLGIAGLLLAAAVIGGLGARRRPVIGAVVVGLLGVLGLAAAATSPVFRPPQLLAPAAALGVGLATLGWLNRRGRPPEGGPKPGGAKPGGPKPGGAGWRGVRRRTLLRWSAGVGLAAAGTAVAGPASVRAVVGADAFGRLFGSRADPAARALAARLAAARPATPIPPGADFAAAGTPPFLTPNPDFYRIDTALRVPALSATDWSLRVHGMVERELRLDYRQLLARPLVDRPITLTCVSNEVNGPLISTAVFTGVELAPLLREAGPRPGADQLLSTSVDGWTAGTPMDVLLEPGRGALLAVAMNGEPLPAEHGYPARMVVPGLYGFVSATKWLTDLELTTFADRRAYWLDRGWARAAPIKTQSRIDRPRGFQVIPAGPLTAAGIAWAQPHGIAGVEVRLDDGPWRPATLSAEVGGHTWRMWRADLGVAPGSHFISCRATDRRGLRQPAEPAPPIPDGAQGWPVINFTAR
ncbi:DMSO/TMAO reductase YedYZ molybdopterin-dependent catalytic subunit [Pseudonocardia eucalypti]|nr:DMSO/TMAO reductase YedYZ molybdopterin-dependent catalytic subunit [Pseudonocardia eucalypti]